MLLLLIRFSSRVDRELKALFDTITAIKILCWLRGCWLLQIGDDWTVISDNKLHLSGLDRAAVS